MLLITHRAAAALDPSTALEPPTTPDASAARASSTAPDASAAHANSTAPDASATRARSTALGPSTTRGSSTDEIEFNIAAGPAADRLSEFTARAAGISLVFDPVELKGARVFGVYGLYAPLDALRIMTNGTEIAYSLSRDGSGTVLIERKPPQKDPGSRTASHAHNIHTASRSSDANMEEVTIRSSFMPERVQAGAELISVSRADIDALSATTVQSVVHTLPQVFGGGPTEDTPSIGAEARSNMLRGFGINLRGLAAGSTLVLMNGMRRPGSGSQGMFADVSNLPLAAIERVDILPDSSSTFYGADAVGGVANFVMRDHFDGRQTEASYSQSTRGEPNEVYLAQLMGTHTDDAQVLVALDFYSRSSLPAASRALARSDLREYGGDNFDVIQANPGNILGGTRIWAIPHDQDGTALTVAELTPGSANLADRYQAMDLLPSQQRWSAFTSGSYELDESATLFADALIGRRSVRALAGGQAATFPVPRVNPYYVDPTGSGAPVQMTYNFLEDLGPMVSEGVVESYELTLGQEVRLPSDWTVTFAAAYAREKLRSTVWNQVSSEALAMALASTDPATAFNPFGDGSHSNRAVIDTLRASSTVGTTSTLLTERLFLSGPLRDLPGGTLRLSVGAEQRWQVFESSTLSTATFVPTFYSSFRPRRVQALFSELRVPVVGPRNRVFGIESLDAAIGARFESYDDIGNKLVTREGMYWQPLEMLGLRAAFSESFRPPGLLDLDESANVHAYAYLRDPQSPSGFTNTLLWAGRNRDLREERANSWTAGLDLSLPVNDGSVAVTYFNTRFSNRLSQPNFSADLLSNPAFWSLVTRNPPAKLRDEVCERSSASGVAPDCRDVPIGAIVDLRSRNDVIVVTKGFDVLARYSQHARWGEVILGFNGTYILEFSEASAADQPLVNRVSTPHYPIDFRFRASGTWRRGALESGVFLNFQDSYRDTQSSPPRHVRSWTTADINAAYSLNGSGWLGRTTFALSVDNVLDSDPPFLNNTVGIGYDQENGDLTGRVVRFNIRCTW